jgi:CubicO group peptidase (beta-lactamase class C family)
MRIAGLLATLCAVSTAHADPRADKIMYLLGTQREHLHIAGIGVAVVLDGQLAVLDVRGVRDVEHGTPVTLDTVFPIGSCTKSFTAMAVGLAQDEGLLSLDDSPRRWLPYFKMKDPEANERVTLRDLLSHRTGLKAYADLAAEPNVLSREDYLRAAVGATPFAKLRTTFQYSNTMVTAAGAAVARAYQTSWEKVIETKIFAPLGMTSSRSSAFDLGGEGTIGYRWDGQGWKARPVTHGLRAVAPAGAIASTTKDMARWLRMLAGGGVLDGVRFISEATLGELTSPHSKINDTLSYALGWAVYEWNGHKVVEHNGGSEGLSAIVSFMPDRHSGFVVLANSSPTELTQIGKLGAQLWPLILDEPTRTAPPVTPPRTAEPAPATTSSAATGPAGPDLPSAEQLVARAIAAAGGRSVVARHTSMQFRAVGGYVHQGVDVDLTGTYDRGKQVLDERWRAVGKPIGRVRIYFDGAHGAQQTTFGQDETFTGDAEATARRDAVLHPLLELKRLYDAVRVDRKAIVDGEDAFVLVLTPRVGSAVELYIAARSGLVVRRDSGGESTRYSGFRKVDGELVPFASTTTGPLGDKVLTVKQLRFGVSPPASLFGPIARLTRS